MMLFIFILFFATVTFSKVNAAINLSPMATFEGDGVSTRFAGANAIGDVNGDGYDDLVMTSGRFGVFGKIYIYYGGINVQNKTALEADVTITGEAAGEVPIGWSLCIDDLNYDGYEDIIAGAIFAASMRGKVYIFYGGGNLTDKNAAQADTIFTGEMGANYFGYSINFGDLNNDNIEDLTISARGFDSSKGKVYLFYGSKTSEGLVNKFTNKDLGAGDTADVTILGEAASDGFGFSLAISDVNSDDFNDLIAGAQWNDRGANNGGSVYIFWGSAGGIGSPVNASEADVIISNSDVGTSVNGVRFGNRLDSNGDVNGDGIDDLIVGSYDNDSDGIDNGRVYVFYGSSDFYHTNANNADVIFSGELGSQLGRDLRVVDDLNNDGINDIIMSSYYDSSRGRVYIIFGSKNLSTGSAAAADIILTGENLTDSYSSISNSGDINYDGWNEFVNGALAWPSGAYTGKAYLYNLNYGSPSVLLDEISNLVVSDSQVSGSASKTGVNIAGVEFRLDGGDWVACNSDDGAFDEPEEQFSCPLSGLSEGEHTVEVRFVDENKVYIPGSLYGRETFNVTFPVLVETGEDVRFVLIFSFIFILTLAIYFKRFEQISKICF